MEAHGVEDGGYAADAADGGGVFGFVGEDPEGVEGGDLGGCVGGVVAHGGEDLANVFIFFQLGFSRGWCWLVLIHVGIDIVIVDIAIVVGGGDVHVAASICGAGRDVNG